MCPVGEITLLLFVPERDGTGVPNQRFTLTFCFGESNILDFPPVTFLTGWIGATFI